MKESELRLTPAPASPQELQRQDVSLGLGTPALHLRSHTNPPP